MRKQYAIDKQSVNMPCNDCGSTFTVTNGTIRRRGPDHIWRCRTCNKKHISQIQKNSPTNISIYIKTVMNDPLTAEKYREKLSKRAKSNWENKTDEQKKQMALSLSAGLQNFYNTSDEDRLEQLKELRVNNIRKYYQERTPEQEMEHNKALSEARKKYFSEMTRDDLETYREIYRRAWHAKDDAEKEAHANRTREQWKKYSLEERDRLLSSSRDNLRKYWDEVVASEPKFMEWAKTRAIIFASSKIIVGPTEIDFNADLNKMGLLENIDYEWGYASNIKHPEFDEKFPINPLGGKVSPFHAWDFRIKTKHGIDILIDIDGSLHKRAETNPKGSYVHFNDSQRPYQTDGLRAYVVGAYKDKLEPLTQVINVKTGERITYADLLNIIKISRYTKEEIQDAMK